MSFIQGLYDEYKSVVFKGIDLTPEVESNLRSVFTHGVFAGCKVMAEASNKPDKLAQIALDLLAELQAMAGRETDTTTH
jgi:hypothetical protein